MSRQSCYVWFCVFFPTLSLPVYQNSLVNSVCEKVYSNRCLFYFQCSTVNIYKYKGKYLLRRIPHASHGSFNPFVISKKQAHIIKGNTPVASRCVPFFSHTSEPLRTINTFVNVLVVTLLQLVSHTRELLII